MKLNAWRSKFSFLLFGSPTRTASWCWWFKPFKPTGFEIFKKFIVCLSIFFGAKVWNPNQVSTSECINIRFIGWNSSSGMCAFSTSKNFLLLPRTFWALNLECLEMNSFLERCSSTPIDRSGLILLGDFYGHESINFGRVQTVANYIRKRTWRISKWDRLLKNRFLSKF